MRIIFLALGVVLLGGCSIWSIFEGKIARTDWQIQKIVVDGKEYLSPQALKAQAIQDMQAKQDKQTKEDGLNQENTPTDSLGSDLNNSDLNNSDLNNVAENTALPESQEESQNSMQATPESEKQTSEEDFLNISETATMIFDQSQHRIYGIAGCNNYFASYTWKDSDHLEIGNAGMTRKLCHPDALMSFEFRLMRNFSGLFDVKRDKNSMVLDNGKMQIYLQ
ncbi:META domain-containing protein [Helicobacter sp. 11S02596-1]|uniref:META domain-containing protein n=1 Tax=Helicobacter sp. 11S02596-1 TaxID=1476194 RepID=UPI000BA7712F|nr:META domain-containing protein [Helicobacter sp. 11S02596-1]PAF44430.1 hypothetical protein BJI48_02585 [Helicobacter sp. 11S02596-1]